MISRDFAMKTDAASFTMYNSRAQLCIPVLVLSRFEILPRRSKPGEILCGVKAEEDAATKYGNIKAHDVRKLDLKVPVSITFSACASAFAFASTGGMNSAFCFVLCLIT